jgi:methyl-accepting chemotaxis protein
MPLGADEALKAAAATNNWMFTLVTLFALAFLAVFIIVARWYVDGWRTEQASTSKTAADSIAANARLVAQYAKASEDRESRMGERLTAVETETRTTLISMNNKLILAMNDSTHAIQTINATMTELVRETRNQTGAIQKAAGEVHDVAEGSKIGRKVSDSVHE